MGSPFLFTHTTNPSEYGFFVDLSKSIMGDDIMSPGEKGGGNGYGKRTLLGPEGAIKLNDKDTVIAGTNLFDKADDMVSQPKGSVSVSNKTTQPKEQKPTSDFSNEE